VVAGNTVIEIQRRPGDQVVSAATSNAVTNSTRGGSRGGTLSRASSVASANSPTGSGPPGSLFSSVPHHTAGYGVVQWTQSDELFVTIGRVGARATVRRLSQDEIIVAAIMSCVCPQCGEPLTAHWPMYHLGAGFSPRQRYPTRNMLRPVKIEMPRGQVMVVVMLMFQVALFLLTLCGRP
jgi:hypothetical protein